MPISSLVTVYFWLFLAFVFVGFAWAIVSTIHDKGIFVDFALNKQWLINLLRRGYDGGYLYVEHKPSRQFMRYRKYIHGKGDYGLEVRCLGLDWMESAWRNVQSVAEQAGRPHRVELIETRIGGRNAFVIDCGRDTAVAYEIGRSIWTDVFGLTLETPYKAAHGHWSIVNELIDGPDHPPPIDEQPPEKALKEMDGRYRKAGLPSLARIFSVGALMIVFLISSIGFPIAMLTSRGEIPDWSYQVGTIGFGGSAASLIWFLVFILSNWGEKKLLPRNAKQSKQNLPDWAIWWGRALAIGLPFAVFFAWAGF